MMICGYTFHKSAPPPIPIAIGTIGRRINRGVAPTNIIATDFNPLKDNDISLRTVGSTNIKSDQYLCKVLKNVLFVIRYIKLF